MANTFSRMLNHVIRLFSYKPEDPTKLFILEEMNPSKKQQPTTNLKDATDELDATLRLAHRVETALDQTKTVITGDLTSGKIKAVQKEIQSLEKQAQEIAPRPLRYSTHQNIETKNISASLEENIQYINKFFGLPDNTDYVVRQFFIPLEPPVAASLFFSKTLIDKKDVNATVLSPLLNAKNIDSIHDDVITLLTTHILPMNQVQTVRDFPSVTKAVQSGDTALLVDGSAEAIIIETKGYEHRGVGSPRIEQTIRGNQSAFTDTLLINISLVRLMLRSPDLISDTLTVGSRSRTDCAVMYLKSVANPSLVTEVKRRIAGIRTDSLSPGTLNQFIQDHPKLPFPQILTTERPDRVSTLLSEGRVAILVDGDPFALVAPISLFMLFQSTEDLAMEWPIGTLVRILRYLGALATVIIPSLFIGLGYYHPEGIPSDLLVALAGSREQIPFPALVEILFMEVSFEFIREAGTRKPGLLGETIGIVGGLILGQSVVAANLISPITVVVVAITGVASFSVPDYMTVAGVRLIRFAFLLLSTFLGLVGVASGLIVLTAVLCHMRSFGVPYMAPVAPKTTPGLNVVALSTVYRQEERPDELNPLDQRRQPAISRKWLSLRWKEGKKT